MWRDGRCTRDAYAVTTNRTSRNAMAAHNIAQLGSVAFVLRQMGQPYSPTSVRLRSAAASPRRYIVGSSLKRKESADGGPEDLSALWSRA